MKRDYSSFDIIVVGGGHAGVEAACAAARMGASVALVSQRLSAIGAMSCNPAIGGIGKGHLVREIDAMDGIMGKAADAAAIQFRLLNRRKGAAVHGPRVQADRRHYAAAVQNFLKDTSGLALIQDECTKLIVQENAVSGVETESGKLLRCAVVILTTGTFLNGVIHCGGARSPGGRVGDKPSVRIANQLAEIGFALGRLKTGTPPRLDGRTINFAKLEQQWGDEDPNFLSSMTKQVSAPQTLCHVTRTTASSHELVRQHIRESAVYSGAVSGNGPRYCPSIEDKVVRFGERESHQVFLEPEGLGSARIYPNGLSTSLSPATQLKLIRTMPGLEHAAILEAGYAIEYDFITPTEILSNLMTRRVRGLFFAGQINGTTGYEEAAAQGLVAGISGALYLQGRDATIFNRANSYIGVMIDDLTSRGVSEPYRMFTSRAEFRLSLRADNADERLTQSGIDVGVIGASRRKHFSSGNILIAKWRSELANLSISSATLRSAGIIAPTENSTRSALEWASFSDVTLRKLSKLFPSLTEMPPEVMARLDTDAKYRVYVERQSQDIERRRADERLRVPPEFDFDMLSSLSNEARAKFKARRPATIAQASAIEGITPAAILLLAARVRRLQTENLDSRAVSRETAP